MILKGNCHIIPSYPKWRTCSSNLTLTEERRRKVIFAIHQGFHAKSKPLLELELIGKYKSLGLKNIIVKTFHKFDELIKDKELRLKNSTLCIDEIDMEDLIISIFLAKM